MGGSTSIFLSFGVSNAPFSDLAPPLPQNFACGPCFALLQCYKCTFGRLWPLRPLTSSMHPPAAVCVAGLETRRSGAKGQSEAKFPSGSPLWFEYAQRTIIND